MSKYIDLNEAIDLFKGIDATMTSLAERGYAQMTVVIMWQTSQTTQIHVKNGKREVWNE